MDESDELFGLIASGNNGSLYTNAALEGEQGSC